MNSYPWYEIVSGETLEQGDILFSFPIFLPDPDLAYPFQQQDIGLLRRSYDVILTSQSCDLVNDKVSDLLALAPPTLF